MVLLRRVDREKFKELTYPHLDFLYNIALKYTSKTYDAEDLVQETMYTAYRKFHQLRELDKCRAWLFSILRSHFLRERRQFARRPLLDDGTGYLRHVQDHGADDFAAVLDSKLDAVQVGQALLNIPEKFRAVVVLYYMEEMTYREISDFLDIPIGTVMSRLARGKKQLKKALLKSAYAGKKGGRIVRLAGMLF